MQGFRNYGVDVHKNPNNPSIVVDLMPPQYTGMGPHSPPDSPKSKGMKEYILIFHLNKMSNTDNSQEPSFLHRLIIVTSCVGTNYCNYSKIS